MKRLIAVLVLSGCGPAWQGTVSGYGLDQKEALFFVTGDGLDVVLTDQQNLCTQLASPKAPPNATLALFQIARQQTGDYVVGSTAAGIFFKADASGTNTIPSKSGEALSGVVKVTDLSLEQGLISGTFEGKFGAQNDAVTAMFQASRCTISVEQLARGFLGAPASSSKAGSCSGSTSCQEYTGAAWTASNAEGDCCCWQVYSPSGCAPSTYGKCTLQAGQNNETVTTFYRDDPMNPTWCTQSGGKFQR